MDPFLRFGYAVKKDVEQLGSVDTYLECQACKASVYALDSAIRTKVVTKALEQFGVLVCNQIESLNHTVCPGAVTEMGDIIVPVLTNFLLSPDYLCSRVMKICTDPFEVLDHKEFVTRILSDKPEFLKNNDFVHNLY